MDTKTCGGGYKTVSQRELIYGECACSHCGKLVKIRGHGPEAYIPKHKPVPYIPKPVSLP